MTHITVSVQPGAVDCIDRSIDRHAPMRQVSHAPTHPQADAVVRLFADHAAFQAQVVGCGCGWRGLGRQAERGRLYDIGVEVLCPACTRRLGVALFAAEVDETETSMAEGSAAARSAAPKRERAHLDPALARLLDLFDALSPADHERAQALLACGLPLTREAWVEAFFSGYDAEHLPSQIEAHLPRPFARRSSSA